MVADHLKHGSNILQFGYFSINIDWNQPQAYFELQAVPISVKGEYALNQTPVEFRLLK